MKDGYVGRSVFFDAFDGCCRGALRSGLKLYNAVRKATVLSIPPPALSAASPTIDLLLIDSEAATAKYAAILRTRFRVNMTTHVAVAVECLRRAWYACLACRKVWIAKRQD